MFALSEVQVGPIANLDLSGLAITLDEGRREIAAACWAKEPGSGLVEHDPLCSRPSAVGNTRLQTCDLGFGQS